MKFTLSWLQKYVDTAGLSPEELAEELVDSSLAMKNYLLFTSICIQQMKNMENVNSKG